MNNFAEIRENPSPLFLIQGEVAYPVATVKIAVDKTVIEAGSSVLEGLDRLFKL